MEPFNIQFTKEKQEYTLTVQPAEGYFKVIYFGAIISVIEKKKNTWQKYNDYTPEPGDVPLYAYKQGEGTEAVAPLKLTREDLKVIGASIDDCTGG